MQTYMANPDKIERKWYVVDAEGCTLGRLASGVASVLRGKNKPQFTPHVDTGDYVIVVNADKIKVTGKKLEQKMRKNEFDFEMYLDSMSQMKKMGGLSVMKERNEEKAKILYDFLDQSKLFKGTVRKEDRSLMNVPFVTGDAELDAKFVKEATAAGFVNLKGHRTVGGMRASIYNAMPKEGVEKLVEFMKKFEEENA